MTKQQWSLVTDVFKGQIRSWGTRKRNKWDTVCFLWPLQTDTHSRSRIVSKSDTNTLAYHAYTRCILLEKDFSNWSPISGVFRDLPTHIWFASSVKVLQSQGSVPFLQSHRGSKVHKASNVCLAHVNWIHFNVEQYRMLKNRFPFYRWNYWCKWGWKVIQYGGEACLNRVRFN